MIFPRLKSQVLSQTSQTKLFSFQSHKSALTNGTESGATQIRVHSIITQHLEGDDSTLKNCHRPNFFFFFYFFSVPHLPIERKLFCFYQNFIYSAYQRFHGGQKKLKFTAKNETTAHRSQLDKFCREILSKIKPTVTLFQFAGGVMQTE